MSVQIDTLTLAGAFKDAGLKRSGEEMTRAIQDGAMRDVPSNADIRDAVHTMTVRVGIMVGGSTLALIIAIVGALISLSD